MSRSRLLDGDVLGRLPELEAGSFDAVLSDPPYGLGFMGRAWDHAVPSAVVWAEVLRVLKPGAPLLAFGGTRTYHRLACAIEDAGFEIRDSLLAGAWTYGSGFPKSLDLSKALDRQRDDREPVLEVTRWIAAARDAAGLTNRDIDEAFGFNGMAGHWTSQASQPAVPTLEQVPRLLRVVDAEPPEGVRRLLLELNGRKGEPGEAWFRREVLGGARRGAQTQSTGRYGAWGDGGIVPTAPATPDAARWFGYGTALKPAWEPVVLAMKPLAGTFAANALEHGVAGLNIDGGRVGTDGGTMVVDFGEVAGTMYGGGAGRWPSNLLLCHHPECREAGTRRVKGAGWRDTDEANGVATATYGDFKEVTTGKHYADDDGRETVTAWDCHPDCPVAALDRQAGESTSTGTAGTGESDRYGAFTRKETGNQVGKGDTGGASRFYFQAAFEAADFLIYRAKADRAERELGMRPGELCRHPTLKPIALAAYLAKLILPPPREDGEPRRLLVPFSGAGSEIIGALRAGWEEVVGIDNDPASVEDARQRISGDAPLLNAVEVSCAT